MPVKQGDVLAFYSFLYLRKTQIFFIEHLKNKVQKYNNIKIQEHNRIINKSHEYV